MVLSQAIEDYLKAIYKLDQKTGGASTTKLAEEMDVSSASVTNMIKRLAKMGLVEYQSYRGAKLTETGKKIALEVIRHHRLLELYLMEMMGYSWDEVHDEAEKLEHHISEQFEDKIAELLDHPTHDPHGDPIPSKEGTLPPAETEPLADASLKQDYLVRRVVDQDPELLRYLEKIGLLPGVKVSVVDKAPFNGPITLIIEDKEQALGYDLASNILVTRYS
jgi:DtxR family transcriptional regulator, Mn-dependent transcriptional regulator